MLRKKKKEAIVSQAELLQFMKMIEEAGPPSLFMLDTPGCVAHGECPTCRADEIDRTLTNYQEVIVELQETVQGLLRRIENLEAK